jgi:hypothetical protein
MQHKPYETAAKTDVVATWKRHGWTPPSEQQEYQDKWMYFRSLYLQEPESCVTDS